MARPRVVPGEAEWAGHEQDLEAQYAHRLYFGKTTDEIMYDFRDLVIERASELREVPRPVFQYYVFAFVDLFASPGESAEQADCASVFLLMLCGRERHDPGSVAEIYDDLRATVEHIANNQAFYDADVDIYGDFREHAAELAALCGRGDGRG
ncbi:MAG TPA: hypothetical protein VIN75_02710 [Burkholderiaceae bacterium]